MNVPFVDLKAQHQALKAELYQAFDEVMTSCQFILGDNVKAFEEETAESCEAAHGIGLNSGTDALLLALLALGVGPGDEVITTPFTFFATAETISLTGATPVFADIDLQTFNLDPAKAAAKITNKTKAIMPVHLFGQFADVEAFAQIAQENSLHLIYDGAQAIGASYQGKPLGAWGEFSTISFFPTKNLGACGDGGMALTNSDELAEKVKRLRFHGSGGGYMYREVGYCSRLDGLQAAFLRVKAKHLTDWNDMRRKHAGQYQAGLGNLNQHLVLPVTADGNHHVFHQYTLRVGDGRRDALKVFLQERGVASAVYYPVALHLQEVYQNLGYQPGDLPESERASEQVLSLPIHPDLSDEQVQHVIDSVRAFFA
jgi:dTDP-4-amino-4,6-dideoxygalactose transaminase